VLSELLCVCEICFTITIYIYILQTRVGGQVGGQVGGGSGRDRRAEYSTTFQNTPEHSGTAAAATTSAID